MFDSKIEVRGGMAPLLPTSQWLHPADMQEQK